MAIRDSLDNVARLGMFLLLTLAVGAANAQAHPEGLSAGSAANALARSQVSGTSAQAVVPLYSTTAPEARYFGRPDLPALARDRLAACQRTPQAPGCEALQTAMQSANTPREALSPYDPALLAARRISDNPALALEDIAKFYAGCQVDTTPTPATENRVCRQYRAGADLPLSCNTNLQVSVERSSNCPIGEWFAHAQSGSAGVDVQCLPDRSAANQHLRVTAGGTPLVFLDVDMATPRMFPTRLADLPFNEIGGVDQTPSVWLADNACDADTCHATVLVARAAQISCTGSGGDAGDMVCTSTPTFIQDYGNCPAGTLSGDHIVWATGAPDDFFRMTTLDMGSCYAPSAVPSADIGSDITGAFPGNYYWRVAAARPLTGWHVNPAAGVIPQMALRYLRARTTHTVTERWDEQCPQATPGARCAPTGAPRCVDGPATHMIEGIAVTRDCWRFETTLSCQGNAGPSSCADLQAAGCRETGSRCLQKDATGSQCDLTEKTYACALPAGTTPTVSNCPANVFCVGESCFNTSGAPDADFARAMAFMEAAREAGTYLDTDRLQVFKGEADSCRDRLFKNCCYADSAGKGMSNQSLLGAGSRLVFDVLMNAENREFIYQGISAMLFNGGFNGAFSSYGVTVAVNGTALPAGSSVLYAGENLVIAFDPWSLAIGVVMYAVTSLTSCDQGEAKLAMKQGVGLCHSVGSYCSSCIRLLGHCISCIEHTTGKCCFNSVLARIVNEQGRQQLGRGWGDPKSPDCAGFSVAQLQTLDFARMDLSEFYASIVPSLPQAQNLQDRAKVRAGNCYYGKGKC